MVVAIAKDRWRAPLGPPLRKELTMRTITTKELIETNLAFHAAGLLTAQSEVEPRCTLVTKEGRNCAIGAVLTSNEMVHTFVDDLIRKKIVDFEDRVFASELQTRHDDWALSTNDEERKYYEGRFLSLLNERRSVMTDFAIKFYSRERDAKKYMRKMLEKGQLNTDQAPYVKKYATGAYAIYVSQAGKPTSEGHPSST